MSTPELKVADLLAIQRTRMASERTLMAWIRTAISLISFGFTIFKFLQYMIEQGGAGRLRPEGPRNLGFTLVALGVFALLFAAIQHWRFVRGLPTTGEAGIRWDLALSMASLIAVMGLLVLMNIAFRIGPF